MTSMKTQFPDLDEQKRSMSANELAEMGGRKLVYIRHVCARDVLDDLKDEDGLVESDFSEADTLYSVHASDGERIALVGDREIAFAAARQHEMNPVSVH